MLLKIIFFTLLFFMMVIYLLRILFAKKYFEKIKIDDRRKINQKKYTVIQPILSGDIRLKDVLMRNIKNLSEMNFLWLIDKGDDEAERIVSEIISEENCKERIKVLEMEKVPQDMNPKIFKIKESLGRVQTEYMIILDDDSIINTKRIDELSMYEDIKGDWLATGIPYNYGIQGFWSKFVAAFINSNSIITYFTMSYLEKNKTINGMFYIARTETFRKHNVFEEIKYWLCDDFALAQNMLSKNITIIQTGIFCNTGTTIKNFRQYLLLMKRWLLFTKIYMKNAMTLYFLIFILLPSILSSVLLIMGISMGINYILTVFLTLLVKSLLLYRLRFFMLGEREEKFAVIREMINDIGIFFIFIYTLITPPVIKWRDKKIRVAEGKIRYEKI